MLENLQLIRNMPLPQLHKDVIIGAILGDGSFKRSEGWATLLFGQGTPNKEYLYYLFDILKEGAKPTHLEEPKEYKYRDGRYDKEYSSYQFWIRGEFLLPFYELFLDSTVKAGKVVKIVPSCMEELLTPGVLAFWLQDDGQFVQRGGVTLCTDNFTYEEVLLLKSILENKYGLACTIHNKNVVKGYYRIYISGKSIQKLQALVSSYFHGSMLYKIKL